jgi:lysophospholipase L1-like esterase
VEKSKSVKLKTILCYGDSITWGYNPKDGTRYEYFQTWPGVMEKSLGNGYRVITEAITGRTTCWDLPYAPYRNGKDYLPMLLESHSPLDLVIVMLGLNDLMKLIGKSANESAWGLLSLIRIILSPIFGGVPPKILIIAPPAISNLSALNKMAYEGMEEESKKLAECYSTIAKESKSEFMDSNEYIKVSDIDGIHLLSDQYKILGEVVADKVRKMKL